jgi:hypothetical protein
LIERTMPTISMSGRTSGPPPVAKRAPSALRPGKSFRAIVSLMTATLGAVASSLHAMSRPARIGTPRVAK